MRMPESLSADGGDRRMRDRRRIAHVVGIGLLLAFAPCARPGWSAGGDPEPQAELQAPATFLRAEDRSRTSTDVACPTYAGVPGLGLDASGNPFIANVQQFLDTCPSSDPNLQTILGHFQIRLDGALVTSFPCTEPVSQMPVASYTDPLIALQVLRAMYYMDRGQTGHLPWTPGTLYDWMRAEIQGVNLVTGVVGGYCCETIAGRMFFVGGTHDDYNREFDKTWQGISNVMAFYAHERRHRDDGGFGHSSCCGLSYGCDDTFDESNLSPYGIQWWLEKSWLGGDINVGIGCLSPEGIAQDAAWRTSSANDQFRERFCTSPPPLLTMPAEPGGPCNPRACAPCPSIMVSPSSLPAAALGEPYSQSLTATGGVPPYTWALAGGSLPPGLGLGAAGVLSGTPTARGAFVFTVEIQDAQRCSAFQDYVVWVTRAPRRHLRPGS